MNCSVCNSIISPERLEILNTTLCTKCSVEEKRIGFMVYNHKTAPSLITINPNDKEGIRQAKRANKRRR